MSAARRLLICALLSGICIFAGACAEKEHAVPRVEITSPVGDKSGDVIISYILFDKEGLPASITVKYSVDGTVPVKEATQGSGGDGITHLSSSLRGVAHSYVWNSLQDIGPAYHNNVIISITPTTHRTGKTACTRNFTVKNSVRVDNGPAASSAEAPAICADATTIYVAWSDNRGGDYDVFCAASTDGGATWPVVSMVNDVATGDAISPSIAVEGSTVYLVWADDSSGNYDILFSSSIDGGANWSTPTIVGGADAGLAASPSIAVDGTAIYVVWSDNRGGDYDILFSSSIDGGANWTTPVPVCGTTAGDAISPSIAVKGGVLYVAWSDNTDGNYDIFCSVGASGGASWSTAEKLNTGTTGDATSPSVAVEGSTVYVAWADARTDSGDIYLRRSIDSGAIWGAEKKVNTDAGNALQTAPNCIATGASLYVVWEDSRDGDANIYFSESADSGLNFTPEVRIDDDVTSAAQTAPAVSLQGSLVIIAFQDGRSGDADIYFTKK